MSNEITLDMIVKIATIAGVIYLIYVFIQDRFGKK